MTHEEAKEFLMNKKVFVKGKSKEIQKKLFDLGFKWAALSDGATIKEGRYFLFLNKTLKITYVNEVGYFYNHKFKEISVEDILNIKVEHLPKTWEEFCENNSIKKREVAITTWSTISKLKPNRKRISNMDKCALPNAFAAKAYLALMQLHQLRDCYRGNVDPYECQYAIVRGTYSNNLLVIHHTSRFLSFPTEELANEFLTNFRDLIEEAGDLI